MRRTRFQRTPCGQWTAAGLQMLAMVVSAGMMAGRLAADSIGQNQGPTPSQRIEADWLRQEAARSLSQSSSVATQSDAPGGVDGVKTGGWGFHTSNDKEPWWQVDLGKVMPLDRVLIFNSHLPERAARLKLLLSPDGKTWREVYAHDGTPLPGASKPLAVPLKGVEGRFVRILLPGPQGLNLDEVEGYSQADPT